MNKYPNNKSLHKKLKHLEELHERVFEKDGNGKINHIPCSMMPVGLTEDKYIFIYRKQ